MAQEKAGREDSRGKLWLEGIAASLGALLALGTIGIILWDEWRGEGLPPDVTVEARGVQEGRGGFMLKVLADNHGDRTAAQVVVEGQLRRGGEVVATSETTFDYVPSHSHREGGLFFAEDPRGFEVQLRAKGYVDP